MKIRLLLIACFVAITGVCFAQNVVIQDSVQTTNKMENTIKPVIPRGRTILADMKTNNPVMYSQYISQRKMQKKGTVLSCVGGGLIAMGALFSIIPDTDSGDVKMGTYIIETDGDNSALRTAGVVLMGAGAVCLSIGIPVMIVGKKKKNQTFQDFTNQHYLSQQPSSYFQMTVYPNRAGIAYVF